MNNKNLFQLLLSFKKNTAATLIEHFFKIQKPKKEMPIAVNPR